MFTSRMISAILASGLILGSMGSALAASQTKEGYQLFLQGKVGATIADPGIASTAPTDHPFALYLRRQGNPENAGIAVDSSHIATAKDEALNRPYHDPFK